MGKKTITISEEVYEKLVELKEKSKAEWEDLKGCGWTREEILSESNTKEPTFNGIISGLLKDIEFQEGYINDLRKKHCYNCCSCDDCITVRIDISENEDEWELEEE